MNYENEGYWLDMHTVLTDQDKRELIEFSNAALRTSAHINRLHDNYTRAIKEAEHKEFFSSVLGAMGSTQDARGEE